MPHPAIILSETGWTHIPPLTGPLTPHTPALCVDGALAPDLPEVDVLGLLGLPIPLAPGLAIDEVRDAVKVVTRPERMSSKAEWSSLLPAQPSALTAFVNSNESVMLCFAGPRPEYARVVTRLMRTSSNNTEVPATWSIGHMLAGRHIATNKGSQPWVVFGAGADAVMARARLNGETLSFSDAALLPGGGAESLTEAIAHAIHASIERMPGVASAMASAPALRHHCVAIARLLATHLVRKSETDPGRVERKVPIVPAAAARKLGLSTDASSSLGQGLMVTLATSLHEVRKRLQGRPTTGLAESPLTAATAPGPQDVVIPEGAGLIAPHVSAALRMLPKARITAIGPRDLLKFAESALRMGATQMAGRAYVSDARAFGVLAGFGNVGIAAVGKASSIELAAPAVAPATAAPRTTPPPPPPPPPPGQAARPANRTSPPPPPPPPGGAALAGAASTSSRPPPPPPPPGPQAVGSRPPPALSKPPPPAGPAPEAASQSTPRAESAVALPPPPVAAPEPANVPPPPTVDSQQSVASRERRRLFDAISAAPDQLASRTEFTMYCDMLGKGMTHELWLNDESLPNPGDRAGTSPRQGEHPTTLRLSVELHPNEILRIDYRRRGAR